MRYVLRSALCAFVSLSLSGCTGQSVSSSGGRFSSFLGLGLRETDQVVPSEVQELKVSGAQGSLKVSWNAVPGVSEYSVAVFSGDSTSPVKTLRTESNFLVIEGLTAGGLYTVEVSCDGNRGRIASRQKGAPFHDPKLTSVSGSHQVRLQWTSAPGETYQVYYGKSKDKLAPFPGATSSPATVTGLADSVAYYFALKVRDASGAERNVVLNSAVIALEPGQPAKPQDLRARIVDRTDVVLTWVPVEGVRYRIERTIERDWTKKVVVADQLNAGTFKNWNVPVFNATYSFRVIALLNGQESEPSTFSGIFIRQEPYTLLKITYPVPRLVFQRSQQNLGRVLVEGSFPSSGVNKVEARLIARPAENGTVNGAVTTDWQFVASGPNANRFSNAITAQGGWYDLEVRAMHDNFEMGTQKVLRVGVGEVFIIAGQSNAYGYYNPDYVASDDRVSILDYNQGGEIDPVNLPLKYSQAGQDKGTGPKGTLFFWGGLGDLLVSRLNVPVLFYGVAHPATSSEDWLRTARGERDVVFGSAHPNAPYYHLKFVLQNYVKKTGVRTVLWHQGEYDVDTSRNDYYTRMQEVIYKARTDGFSDLNWMIARASFMPDIPGQFYGKGYRPEVIAGQNLIIANVPKTYPGPNTDDEISFEERRDGCHFADSVYPEVAGLWSSFLSDEFFRLSLPSMP